MARGTRVPGWVLAGVITATIGATGFPGGAMPARATPETGASMPLPVVTVEGTGSAASVSGDGRFVAAVAPPPTADGRRSTVYLRDRSTGTTVELTQPVESAVLGDSVQPLVSTDGCVVAVVTEIAYDVFRDDNQGERWDVYRTVLPDCGGTPGQWELVSTVDGAARGDVDASDRPAMSASGAIIAYTRTFDATSPLLDAQAPIRSIDVVDLTVTLGTDGRVVPAAGMPNEEPRTTFRYAGQGQPSLSSDGRYLAFRSDTTAADPVPSWGTGPVEGSFATQHVFVHDRQSLHSPGAVGRATAGPPEADGTDGEAVLSGDGRVLVFSSTSTTLVEDVTFPPCEPACTQVYALDRDPDDDGTFHPDDEDTPATLTLLSREPPAVGGAGAAAETVAGTAASGQPTVSSDGSLVAFVTQAANLLTVKGNGGSVAGQGDVVVADVAAGTIRRASVGLDGLTPIASLNARPQLNETGRVLVYDTAAPELVQPLDATGLAPDGDTLGRAIVAVTSDPVLAFASLDVGTAAPGFSSPEWWVTVVNDGPSGFLPAVATSSNPEFAISGGSCLVGGLVPPAGSCSVNIIFTPSGGGPRAGTITVAEFGFGAVSVKAEVRGSGGEPALVPSPSGLEFGDPAVGHLDAPQTVEIRNVGLVPAAVGAVAIGGAHPGDFEVLTNGCQDGVLFPGDSCVVEVGFAPLDSGHRTATLTVATTGVDQYTAIVLGGNGHYEPAIATSAQLVEAGTVLGVGGTGFPAATALTVGWADGADQTTTVTTNEDGTFLIAFDVPRSARPGERTLVVAASPDESAAATVRIVRTVTRTPGSATWPGR